MSLTYQALVMMVLVICSAVALAPKLLLPPIPRRSPPFRFGAVRDGLWLVESPGGKWFVNGIQHPKPDLRLLLQRHGSRAIHHYLPSDALPFDRVSRSLRYLRSLTPDPVVLELPPEPKP